MEDDLDNLIADSLGGVQTALDGERKAAAPAASSGRGIAEEAVKELQQGPRPDGTPGPEFFENLLKTFQDPNFQKAIGEALQANEATAGEKREGDVATCAPPGAASATSAASSQSDGPEEFLKNFMKSFDSAVGSDSNFERSLTSLLTSMLSTELLCDPLQQIVDRLDPWLKSQKGLSSSEKSRYEAQLRVYRQLLAVYKGSPDPLPDAAREEVQRLLAELQSYGQPPDEVMRQIAPKEAETGGESFEDFMKQMGLDSGLGAAEQDLLKKLTEDPEELTKVMKDMAGGLPDEACKQQ